MAERLLQLAATATQMLPVSPAVRRTPAPIACQPSEAAVAGKTDSNMDEAEDTDAGSDSSTILRAFYHT